MIIIDTHVWVWWTSEDPKLKEQDRSFLHNLQDQGIAVSIFSVWEVAKLHEKNRLEFSMPLDEWIEQALALPYIELIPITPQIIVESVNLPGEFHRDPADQMIVATSRVLDIQLFTYDSKILGYPHIKLLPTA